jgi:hypothetical protein
MKERKKLVAGGVAVVVLTNYADTGTLSMAYLLVIQPSLSSWSRLKLLHQGKTKMYVDTSR